MVHVQPWFMPQEVNYVCNPPSGHERTERSLHLRSRACEGEGRAPLCTEEGKGEVGAVPWDASGPPQLSFRSPYP